MVILEDFRSSGVLLQLKKAAKAMCLEVSPCPTTAVMVPHTDISDLLDLGTAKPKWPLRPEKPPGRCDPGKSRVICMKELELILTHIAKRRENGSSSGRLKHCYAQIKSRSKTSSE